MAITEAFPHLYFIQCRDRTPECNRIASYCNKQFVVGNSSENKHQMCLAIWPDNDGRGVKLRLSTHPPHYGMRRVAFEASSCQIVEIRNSLELHK